MSTLDIGGQLIPVPVNEPALSEIAQQTGGTHHRATSGDQLASIYRSLGSQVGYRKEFREVTGQFVGVSPGLGLTAAALSLAFARRLS
jgi:Ca-activated chloride channel family protein